MSSFNASVYDAVLVGLSESYTASDLQINSEAIAAKLSGYQTLFNNIDFFNSVSGSVNDAAKVATRIEAMMAYLKDEYGTFEIATSIPQRIKELNILTTHAEFCQVDNEELYNSLCRASSVLIASHLEGFLKELTNGLIQDLNFNLGSFSKMPTAIQRTFCKKIAFYEGIPDKEIEGRVSQLLDFFQETQYQLT